MELIFSFFFLPYFDKQKSILDTLRVYYVGNLFDTVRDFNGFSF